MDFVPGSHALLQAGLSCGDPAAKELAINSLDWLVEVQISKNGHFRAIGNKGWHSRDSAQNPPIFDQQPIEAHASLSACLAAWRATGGSVWFRLAENTFSWFLGINDLGLPLYDTSNGGCYGGLQPHGVNENQGAESLLAYHLSLAEMEQAAHRFFNITPWGNPAHPPQLKKTVTSALS